uniref:Arf-GAP domain-containing protein n=1 Tax=Bionectria ochroleuca TaxID=29856 RepID=A0A0B7K546_BIOOC
MSRRAPNPAAERAAKNQATIKSLLKLEPNKICADCKRNKHPRWASWNLGVFICIRCSGIHRGMGTHISKVKSVDLDSWTDEQMQSILSWGNARANKYFEAKLAPGHVPSEAKIENFIRTKYELKRWAMEGPRPDPATLGADADDDVPLSVVKEKQAIDRKASVTGGAPPQAAPAPPPKAPAPEADLIGGDDIPPARSSTAGPSAVNRVPPKAEPAPPKATSNASLLGLDFFGEPVAPPRPASTTGVSSPAGQSRPDLKQSILSLYASAPKPQPQAPQQPQHQHQGSFGGLGSMPPQQQQQQQAFGSAGGFNDAFSTLSIGGTAPAKPAPADPFASFGSGSASRAPPKPASNNNAFGGLSGGGFFDPKPAQPSAPQHQSKPSDGGFGDFGGFASPPAPAPAPAKPVQTTSSSMGDLFDLSAPAPQTTSPPPPVASATTASSSVFNLSAPQAAPAPAPKPAAAATAGFAAPGWGSGGSSFANVPIVPGSGGGFNPAPQVSADEEFGGWASSTAPASNTTGKPAGAGADEDLFSNVWQ